MYERKLVYTDIKEENRDFNETREFNRNQRIQLKWICNMHNVMEHKENESGAKKKIHSIKCVHEEKLESFHASNLTACFKGYKR